MARRCYVANAHANAIAVVALSAKARGATAARSEKEEREDWQDNDRSKVRGFIPTGQYPSAVAVVGRDCFRWQRKGHRLPELVGFGRQLGLCS